MDFFKIHLKQFFIILIFIFFLLTVVYFVYDSYKLNDILTFENQEKKTTILISIKGCINNPGKYEIESNASLLQIIDISGGLTKEANTSNMDLTSKITNNNIFIPCLEESSTNANSNKVSLNNSTLEQLATLPGIGPSKAQKIIDYRNTYGPFKKLEEIKNVKGIGSATYEKLKNLLTL